MVFVTALEKKEEKTKRMALGTMRVVVVRASRPESRDLVFDERDIHDGHHLDLNTEPQTRLRNRCRGLESGAADAPLAP